MRFNYCKYIFYSLIFLGFNASAQDAGDPLRIQGIDQFNYIGAFSRSLAGSNVSQTSDITSMFVNPALLSGLNKLNLKVGAAYYSNNYQQTQQWTPNRFYAEMSLIFENKDEWNASKYVKMLPDWTTKKNVFRPSLFAASYPFNFGDYKITTAVAYADYINLDQYYQNNNLLDPNIGQMRPQPYPVLVTGDTMRVNWYKFVRERKGNIYGITPAVSFAFNKDFSLGLSFTMLNGKSDDIETRNLRGSFLLRYNNSMRIDTNSYFYYRTGTSEYKGNILNIGFTYNQDLFNFGVNIRPPVTIKRTFNYSIAQKDTSSITGYNESGTDEIKFPFFMSMGITVHPTKRLNLSIAYDIRTNSDVEYTNEKDSTYKPYVNSNLFKIGLEYIASKMFSVRAGYRENTQSFVPAGAALLTKPATGSVYSAGLGFKYEFLKVDIAYEYSLLSYDDMWLSNVNFNKTTRHFISVEAGVEF